MLSKAIYTLLLSPPKVKLTINPHYINPIIENFYHIQLNIIIELNKV